MADVLMAGHVASEIAYRMVVPGGEVSWQHITIIRAGLKAKI